MGKYITVDISGLNEFVDALGAAGKTEFKKELRLFMNGLAQQFLTMVQDYIIEKKNINTRLLLNSFHIGKIENEGFTIEVGSNVEYAEYVNKGHWLNPKGVDMRFVPGYWKGDEFIYTPGAKSGMMLKQNYVKGSHYWDDALRDIEKALPGILEDNIQNWINSYFGMG